MTVLRMELVAKLIVQVLSQDIYALEELLFQKTFVLKFVEMGSLQLVRTVKIMMGDQRVEMDAQVFVNRNMDGSVIPCLTLHQLLSQQLCALGIVGMDLFRQMSYVMMAHQLMVLDANLIVQVHYQAIFVEEVH